MEAQKTAKVCDNCHSLPATEWLEFPLCVGEEWIDGLYHICLLCDSDLSRGS